jgi:hypothetical protein
MGHRCGFPFEGQCLVSTDIEVSYVSLAISERDGRELSETGRYHIIEYMFSAVAVWAPAVGFLLRGSASSSLTIEEVNESKCCTYHLP